MITNRFIIFIILLSWPLLGVSTARVVDSIVAKVNSDIITLIELENHIKSVKNLNSESNAKAKKILKKEKKEILNKIIEEKLLLQYAKKNLIESSEDDIDKAIEEIKKSNKFSDEMLKMMLGREGMTLDQYRTRLKNQIGLSKVLNREVRARIKLNEDEIVSYYNKNKKSFIKPKEVKVRHILFRVDNKTNMADARKQKKKARRVLKLAKKGDSFEELAKTYSEGPSKDVGGDLGWIKRGVMIPSFEKVAFSMKKGIASDLVKTRYGYHIVKVENIKKEKIKTLDEVKNKIRDILFKNKYDERYNTWIEELKKNSFIEIYLDEKLKEKKHDFLKNKKKRKRVSSNKLKPNKNVQRKTKKSEKTKVDLKSIKKREMVNISKFILAWENAYETKNRKRYFSFYSKDFEINGSSRKKWEKQMEKEYEKYKFIQVEIRNLRVFKRNKIYIATFNQRIKSNINDQIRLVRLYLTKNKKGFKIAQEKWLTSPFTSKEFSEKPLLSIETLPKTKSRHFKRRNGPDIKDLFLPFETINEN